MFLINHTLLFKNKYKNSLLIMLRKNELAYQQLPNLSNYSQPSLYRQLVYTDKFCLLEPVLLEFSA